MASNGKNTEKMIALLLVPLIIFCLLVITLFAISLAREVVACLKLWQQIIEEEDREYGWLRDEHKK